MRNSSVTSDLTAVFRLLVIVTKNSHMRNRLIQNVDFELVYCACVEKFVTSNLKTAVPLIAGL